MGPVEEDCFLCDRDDEATLRGAGRFDVALAEACVREWHPRSDDANGIGIERLHPRDLLAVELRRDRLDESRQGKRRRVVGGQQSRVDDLAADVGERREVDAVGFGDFVATAGIERPNPLPAVGDDGFGELARGKSAGWSSPDWRAAPTCSTVACEPSSS